jgi:2-keto-4-pentenoate hydratase/2-oxohepta-3-ene-1,7-dioic acid hydratase in catechol pathway
MTYWKTMCLVSYRTRGSWRAGIARGSFLAGIEVLNAAARILTVRDLLEAGSAAMEQVFYRAERVFENERDRLIPIDEVEVGPPVPDPDKIICLGLNYPAHVTEVQMGVARVPTFFAKFRNALCGPASPIVLPRVSDQVDYEGELAVVIGRRCKGVSELEALDCIAGYTIMNDVSARDLQMQTSQWTAGKTLDTFAPMGPGIVPASVIPDPQDFRIVTRVNGAVLQQGNTRDMIFPVAETIAFLSSLMTLEPGDIVSTGTPSGVGFRRQPPVFLRDGDIVEVEIERIGSIRNPVVGPDGNPRQDSAREK